MKKIILIAFLALLAGGLMGQEKVYRGTEKVWDDFAIAGISGTDTTLYVKLPGVQSVGSIELRWATITGSGTAAIYVSSDRTNWEAYNSSPSTTVSGSSGSYTFEETAAFCWPYLGIKITKGTISAGTIDITFNIY